MPYSSAEARGELLDSLATAIGQLDLAVDALGEAYELLDEASAERLEDTLFRPLQSALARARHTHGEFAERHRLTAALPALPPPGPPPHDGRAAIERAVHAVAVADETLAALGDSDYVLEVGDVALRAGLAEVRLSLDPLPVAARALERTRGR